MRNFFRKDLNLSKKWWHRLLVVAFIGGTLTLLGFSISVAVINTEMKWKQVELLEDRIDSNISKIENLLKPGEKIEEIGRAYYSLNIYDSNYDDLKEGVYCSENLVEHVETIKLLRGLDEYYIYEKSVHSRASSLDEFKDHIATFGIKCVLPDAETGIDGKRVSFLRTADSLFNQKIQEEWAFYERSQAKTALAITGNVIIAILITLVSALLVMLFYYKVVLYVIFGKRGN